MTGTGGSTERSAADGGGQRLQFLDALRGIAAGYVVFFHLLLIPQPNLVAPRWAEKFALAGGNGVTIFFIVSAFSLYYTMPLRARDARPTLSFYLHRFFRIAPLFYVLVVASLLRDWYVFGVVRSPLEIATSVFFVFNLMPIGQEGFVWASWTIGVEMVFYAVFPLLYARLRSTGQALAFFFATILAWLFVQLCLDYLVIPPEWKASILSWNALKFFPTFALGIVLYFVFHEAMQRLDERARRSLGCAAFAAGLFAFCAMVQGWLPGVFGTAYSWNGPVCALLAFGAALWPHRAIVNRFTSYLGKISYSIYLWHPIVIFALIPLYRVLYERLPNLSAAFILSALATFAATLPLAALSFRFVEKPGIAFGRRWTARAARSATIDAGVALR